MASINSRDATRRVAVWAGQFGRTLSTLNQSHVVQPTIEREREREQERERASERAREVCPFDSSLSAPPSNPVHRTPRTEPKCAHQASCAARAVGNSRFSRYSGVGTGAVPTTRTAETCTAGSPQQRRGESAGDMAAVRVGTRTGLGMRWVEGGGRWGRERARRGEAMR